MPKIKCLCDNIIGLSEIPGPNEYLIISDVEFDKFWDLPDIEKLHKEMSIVAKCSNCGRLHVFWNGFDEPQTIYRKDENGPN